MIYLIILLIVGVFMYDEARYLYFDRPDLGLYPKPTLRMRFLKFIKRRK